MEPFFAMGLFALYVVVVSLVRIMSDSEFHRLTAMKKIWGRTRGLFLHFTAYVGIPLVLGIMFLGKGIAGFDPGHASALYSPLHHQHALQHMYSRTLSYLGSIQPLDATATGEIPHLIIASVAVEREAPEILDPQRFLRLYFNQP